MKLNKIGIICLCFGIINKIEANKLNVDLSNLIQKNSLISKNRILKDNENDKEKQTLTGVLKPINEDDDKFIFSKSNNEEKEKDLKVHNEEKENNFFTKPIKEESEKNFFLDNKERNTENIIPDRENDHKNEKISFDSTNSKKLLFGTSRGRTFSDGNSKSRSKSKYSRKYSKKSKSKSKSKPKSRSSSKSSSRSSSNSSSSSYTYYDCPNNNNDKECCLPNPFFPTQTSHKKKYPQGRVQETDKSCIGLPNDNDGMDINMLINVDNDKCDNCKEKKCKKKK